MQFLLQNYILIENGGWGGIEGMCRENFIWLISKNDRSKVDKARRMGLSTNPIKSDMEELPVVSMVNNVKT